MWCLQWTPMHGYACVGWPVRTYLHEFCANTGYYLDDLPGAIDDRERKSELNDDRYLLIFALLYIYFIFLVSFNTVEFGN